MNNPRLVCVLGGIALLGACASSGTGDGTTGSGGNGSGGSGSGRTTATGGNSGPGTGGASSGGTQGTGGSVSGTGGSNGTGGSGTGGNGNSGGATGTGGNGTGGASAGGRGGSSATGGATGTGGAGATHWVGTWAASPYYDSGNQPPASLSNGVIRQITHVSIGGSQLRVQFSNLFGNGSVTIKSTHIALCKATPLVDSTIDTTTDTALAFSG